MRMAFVIWMRSYVMRGDAISSLDTIKEMIHIEGIHKRNRSLIAQ